VTLIDALSGETGKLAVFGDLYTTRAALVIGSDLAQQHPLLAFQLRANYRHHGMKMFAVTPGPVREDKYAKRSVRVQPGEELAALESLREDLKAGGELLILFGDAIKGDSVRRLVDFGESLGIPVKYVCLVDYSNSRGAMDMGLVPELLPGYQPSNMPGMHIGEMLAAPDLDVLWVAGADPLAGRTLASKAAFVVVQDLFLTETAQQADIVLPSASAYEKNGTVTNVTGEVQRLRAGPKTMGAKPDLEIIGLIGKEMGIQVGIWTPDAVFDEIRRNVSGYNVPLPVIATGGAAATAPVNGRVPVEVRPDLVKSAGDTLYTSGSLGRYSKMLSTVLEAPGALYKQ
jgi:NADH-quinone oxidoreductase subunit G